MMTIYIDGRKVEAEDGLTVLNAARKSGAFIPTLCAFEPLHHVSGSCGLCLVEVEENGERKVCRSCKMPVRDGLRVFTQSAQLRRMRREQLELLFNDHDQNCASCSRHGKCELMNMADVLGVTNVTRNGSFCGGRSVDETDNSIRLDQSKCIRCERCVTVCREVQGCEAIILEGSNSSAALRPQMVDFWKDSDRCVRCGQCILACPTGALSEKNDTRRVMDLLEDPDVVTVAQFAPSVRATLGEEFGLPAGTNVEGKIVAALKALGADYVFDTNFAADVTIMEEGTELLGRLKKKEGIPMFTSCCPGWVNYVELHAPEFIPQLSSTRSPQGIMSSLAKSWLPKKIGVPAEKIRVISVMPCTAKKDEAARPALTKEGLPDTDAVLTVREFAALIRENGIDFAALSPAPLDSEFMSRGTGAAMIFGRRAGVAEAAIRTLAAKTLGRELEGEVSWQNGSKPFIDKEVELTLGSFGTVRVCTVSTLTNAAKLLKALKDGECSYDFVEVMACPGGCVNGGGTRRALGQWRPNAEVRRDVLDSADKKLKLRASHLNPMVTDVYRELLGVANSHTAHTLLHTSYSDRRRQSVSPCIEDVWKELDLLRGAESED